VYALLLLNALFFNINQNSCHQAYLQQIKSTLENNKERFGLRSRTVALYLKRVLKIDSNYEEILAKSWVVFESYPISICLGYREY